MKRIFLLALSGLLFVSAKGQSLGPSALNTTGGSAILASKTYEWSIGEIVATTFSSAGLVVTQGVLQPALNPTGVDNGPPKILTLKVYPNPVNDGVLYLSPSFNKQGMLVYRLTDATGRTILTQKISLQTGNELQSIPMQLLAIGQYTLSVQWTDATGPSSNTYQIQKLF